MRPVVRCTWTNCAIVLRGYLPSKAAWVGHNEAKHCLGLFALRALHRPRQKLREAPRCFETLRDTLRHRASCRRKGSRISTCIQATSVSRSFLGEPITRQHTFNHLIDKSNHDFTVLCTCFLEFSLCNAAKLSKILFNEICWLLFRCCLFFPKS